MAGLIFPPLSSYTAVYVTLAAMLLGAVLLGRRLGDIVRHPAYLAIWLAMALFAVTLPFVWNGADDLLIVLIVLPLALGIGLVALVEVEPRFASPTVIGGLCLFGAIGAMAAGFNDIYVDGLPRAGGGNNPIHFASLSMTLGFFSLIGLFGTRSRWRLVFLVGPLLGLEAVLLSATRGGVLAFALVGLLVALLFAVWLRRSARYLVAGAAVLALAGAAVIVTTPDVTNRALQAFSDADAAIVAFFSEDGFDEPAPNVDPSTDQRIALYRGALGVFRDNPVFGVGTSQIIPAAREFFPERLQADGQPSALRSWRLRRCRRDFRACRLFAAALGAVPAPGRQ